MLIVISPAKSLDYDSPVTTDKSSQPQFMKRSAELVEQLKELSPPQLSDLMGISAKLADLNFGRYLDWKPKATQANARQAVLAFTGDVYQGLNAADLSDADLDFAQQHLRILSGLYGVLRPLDLMQPYRLEMGTRLKTNAGNNLYEFWGDQITDALNKQLKALDQKTLLNLASNEYFSSVKPDKLNAQVISPVFKDFKNGKYKIISFFAKKARGTMTRWVITERVMTADQLVHFSEDGYSYCAAESTPDKPVFLRDGT